MDRNRLEEIFEETDSDWEGDNAFKGLLILSKYTDNLLRGASHDMICGPSIDDVIEKLTEEDAIELRKLNWMFEEDCFCCFV